MMKRPKKISFKNSKGQTLRGFINEPDRWNGVAIISLHGFPGSCVGKRLTKTAELLRKKGFLVMRFDFSGTNISDGKFEDKLMSQEVKEIRDAVDFIKKVYDPRKIVLHGHSTGAIDASLYAHKDQRISKLILSGAVDRLDTAARYDFTDRNIRDFWTKGYITYTWGKRWLKNKRLKKAFYDEFFTLDIPRAMKHYRRPLLVIHGSEDTAVPLKCARALYKYAHKPKKLVIIKGADHQYSRSKWMNEQVEAIARFSI